jgi:hypothetical protein
MSNNKQSSVEWLSNQIYELFEQYSEGNFDRITLNKLVLEATNKAKEMENERMIEFAQLYAVIHCMGDITKNADEYYSETFYTNEK